VVEAKRIRRNVTRGKFLDPHVLVGVGVQHHCGGGRGTAKTAREHGRHGRDCTEPVQGLNVPSSITVAHPPRPATVAGTALPRIERPAHRYRG
jgi:hypothetical protein